MTSQNRDIVVHTVYVDVTQVNDIVWIIVRPQIMPMAGDMFFVSSFDADAVAASSRNTIHGRHGFLMWGRRS